MKSGRGLIYPSRVTLVRRISRVGFSYFHFNDGKKRWARQCLCVVYKGNIGHIGLVHWLSLWTHTRGRKKKNSQSQKYTQFEWLALAPGMKWLPRSFMISPRRFLLFFFLFFCVFRMRLFFFFFSRHQSQEWKRSYREYSQNERSCPGIMYCTLLLKMSVSVLL